MRALRHRWVIVTSCVLSLVSVPFLAVAANANFLPDEDESQLLRKEGLGQVFFGEEELARGMTGHVLARFAPDPAH